MTPQQLPALLHGHLQSSNSTASIFLGGVRRSWMENPSISRPAAAIPSSASSTSTSTTATTTTTSATTASSQLPPHPGMPTPALVLPASSPSTCRSQQNDAVASPPQPPPQPHPPQSLPQPQSQSIAVSPVAAVPSPPSCPSSHPQPQPPAPTAPDPPPPPVTVSIDTTLPPPPTQPSQPSPTASLSLSNLQVSSARPPDSPTGVQSPFLPSGPPFQVNTGVPTPPPTRTSEGDAGDSGRSPLNHVEMQIDSQGNPQQQMPHPQTVQTSHSHPQVPASAALQSQQDEVQPSQHQPQPERPSNARRSSAFIPTIDGAFFEHSVRNLTNYMAYLERTGYHVQTIESARLQLLTKACVHQDCLYLAIHQVYCLYSFSRTEFFKLPCFTEQQARGLAVIEKVMVANNPLSPDFLRWSAHFPGPIEVLVQTPVYHQAVRKAAVCLGRFAEQWRSYVAHVFARGFPPFAAELMEGFAITSSSLAYTIFLSTCRQLQRPGSHGFDEATVKRVWKQDLQNFQRRHINSVSRTQIRQENADIIRLYQSILVSNNSPAGLGPQPPPQQQQTGQQTVQSPNPAAQGLTVNTTMFAMMRPTGIPSPQPSQSPQMPGRGQPVVASPRMATGPPNAPPVPAQAPRRGRPRRAYGVQQQPPPISTPVPGSAPGGVAPQTGLPFQPMVFPSQLVQSFSPRQASSPTQRPVPIPAQPQIPTGVWPNGVPSPGGPRALVSLQQPSLPVRPTHPSIHPQIQSQSQPQSYPSYRFAPGPVAQPLLPPPGHKPSTTSRPHPLRDALHQAHLRGPVNEVQAPQHDQEAGLFQYLSGFAVKPVPLGTEECAYTWQFELSRSDLDRVPASQLPSLGQRAVRAYKDGSQIHRLRCIRADPATSEVSEQAWCTADSIWPGVIYVFINDVEAYVRRRIHNGKDLPLDISHYLREGVNTVAVHFIRNAAETRDLTYAMAVEVLDIVSLSRAKELAQPLAAAESREQIRTRLSPGQQQDDEVSIVSDNLTIDLVDPFMARVFNTPVRGRFCGHQECFDHDTWILTRASKSGNAPMKEDWKCPICHQDARPQSLVIDGFLVEVHEELARANRLETARAIQVKNDGSWQVRAETEASDRSGPDRTASKRKLNGSSSPESPASQKPKVERRPSFITNGDTSAQPACPQPTEVIALD
ncbi:MIZ zinc finger domain protein [Aspergillus affinis]|uniref:MIZ zinc finger domain protein n=1 Tax=Aspergillus affinis TaxID=1070780 RepID=UPI0022FE40B4|nr:uncharacterized protein KD926_000019 [Aspergillus affinis]KAI9037756.1 hypothetical protein KD926_000019 [Aspergillus affinis]